VLCFLFCLSSVCVLFPMFPVSLDCPLLIAPFSFLWIEWNQPVRWILSRSLFRMSVVVCGLSIIKYKRTINKPHHPDIFMNDTPIAKVPNHKHLGLNISKDCTHHIHIDLITEKAYRRLNILHSRLNETPVRRYTVDHHSLFPSRQIILNPIQKRTRYTN
jgi:hypothetical protein